jgi:protein HIRA/HIR1
LIVAKEVFERQIMDLSWFVAILFARQIITNIASRSLDGLTLYAASSDGTIGVFQFDTAELEGIAGKEDHEQYLAKFNFVPPPLPEGYSHFSKEDTKAITAPSQQTNGFDSRAASNVPEKVNILVAKKKRVNLASTTNLTRAASGKGPPPSVNGTSQKRVSLTQPNDNKPQSLMRSASTDFSSSFPAPSEQPFGDPTEGWPRRSDMVQAMDLDVRIDAFDLSTPRNKRKASFSDDGGPRIRPRTLGGDRAVEHHIAKEISSWTAAPKPIAEAAGPSGHGAGRLEPLFAPLPLLTYLKTEVEGFNEVLEAKNVEADGTTEIAFVTDKHTEWLDYLPSPAIALKATSSFCAVAMQDGSLNVYSHAGRKWVSCLS